MTKKQHYRLLLCRSEKREILQIPVLEDNYIYVLHSCSTGETAVVDPAVDTPVLDALTTQNWRLTHVFNTHHHGDHTGGNLALKKHTDCQIYGYAGDAPRIPGIDRQLEEEEILSWGGTNVQVLFVPGHTRGHIAYYLPEESALFCGDALFLMGCGRLFEGTPEQAFNSLNILKQLPDDTLIFCTHEYTQKNGQFALTVEPENTALQSRMHEIDRMRARGEFTVPATLAEEKATNPFLRTDSTEIRQNLGLERASDVEVFAALRERRNHF